MDFVGVKEMLEAVNASNISYFEYETCDGHIVMDKSLTRNISSSNKKSDSSSVVSNNEFSKESMPEVKTQNNVQTKTATRASRPLGAAG